MISKTDNKDEVICEGLGPLESSEPSIQSCSGADHRKERRAPDCFLEARRGFQRTWSVVKSEMIRSHVD